MRGINREILEYGRKLPEGAPLTAKGLRHLGNRAAVDQALSRLAREGELIRTTRGIYVLPMTSEFGIYSPSVPMVVQGLAIFLGETIVPSGAAEANTLGLSNQVPVRYVYLASGPNRKIRLRRQEVELRHAESWRLAPGRMGQALRALEWLGEGDAPHAMERLKTKLTPEELGNLAVAAVHLPPTIARSVRSAVHD